MATSEQMAEVVDLAAVRARRAGNRANWHEERPRYWVALLADGGMLWASPSSSASGRWDWGVISSTRTMSRMEEGDRPTLDEAKAAAERTVGLRT